MPEGWEIGLFIHIVAVFALGGALVGQVLGFTMMRAAKTVQEVRMWGALGRLLTQYYAAPITAAVLLLSGGYLVNEVNEEWSEGWIGISALALIIAVGVGFFFLTPRMKEIGGAAGPAPDGPVPEPVRSKLDSQDLVMAVYGNSMTSIGIIWNMVMKPSAIGSIISIVVFVGIGVATGYLLTQRQTTAG